MNDIISTKDEFFKIITSYIESNGFNQIPDGFEKVLIKTLPNKDIYINQHRITQEGGTVELKLYVKTQGDGYIMDNNEGNKMDFTQFIFTIFDNGNKIREYNDCFYWHEPQYFINIFNQVFTI